MNDGIAESFCSLSYVSVERAMEKVLRLGKGILLVKVNIWNAYKNIPVHMTVGSSA